MVVSSHTASYWVAEIILLLIFFQIATKNKLCSAFMRLWLVQIFLTFGAFDMKTKTCIFFWKVLPNWKNLYCHSFSDYTATPFLLFETCNYFRDYRERFQISSVSRTRPNLISKFSSNQYEDIFCGKNFCIAGKNCCFYTFDKFWPKKRVFCAPSPFKIITSQTIPPWLRFKKNRDLFPIRCYMWTNFYFNCFEAISWLHDKRSLTLRSQTRRSQSIRYHSKRYLVLKSPMT